MDDEMIDFNKNRLNIGLGKTFHLHEKGVRNLYNIIKYKKSNQFNLKVADPQFMSYTQTKNVISYAKNKVTEFEGDWQRLELALVRISFSDFKDERKKSFIDFIKLPVIANG